MIITKNLVALVVIIEERCFEIFVKRDSQRRSIGVFSKSHFPKLFFWFLILHARGPNVKKEGIGVVRNATKLPNCRAQQAKYSSTSPRTISPVKDCLLKYLCRASLSLKKRL